MRADTRMLPSSSWMSRASFAFSASWTFCRLLDSSDSCAVRSCTCSSSSRRCSTRLRRWRSRCRMSLRACTYASSSSATFKPAMIARPSREKATSWFQRLVTLDQVGAQCTLDGVDLAANPVHGTAPEVGAHQLQRGLRSALPVQHQGGIQLRESLADELAQAVHMRADRRRTLRRVAQPAQLGVDLRQRHDVGVEVLMPLGHQKAALCGLGVDHQREQLAHDALRLRGAGDLLIGLAEPPVRALGERHHGAGQREREQEQAEESDAGRELHLSPPRKCDFARAAASPALGEAGHESASRLYGTPFAITRPQAAGGCSIGAGCSASAGLHTRRTVRFVYTLQAHDRASAGCRATRREANPGGETVICEPRAAGPGPRFRRRSKILSRLLFVLCAGMAALVPAPAWSQEPRPSPRRPKQARTRRPRPPGELPARSAVRQIPPRQPADRPG